MTDAAAEPRWRGRAARSREFDRVDVLGVPDAAGQVRPYAASHRKGVPSDMDIEEAIAALGQVAAQHADLRLLVLHGSRSRARQHDRSDWDLGYVADLPFDPAALLSDVTRTLATDDVDLVDLARASALLRFGAARDGRCVYEEQPGLFDSFVLEATLFWCDAEPAIRRAHDAALARLPD